jgi:hypothetical protein
MEGGTRHDWVVVTLTQAPHGSGGRFAGRGPRVGTLLRIMLFTEYGRRDAGRYIRTW